MDDSSKKTLEALQENEHMKPTEWNEIFVITNCLTGGGLQGIKIGIVKDDYLGDGIKQWSVGGTCVDLESGGADGFYDVEDSVEFVIGKMREEGIKSTAEFNPEIGWAINEEEDAVLFFDHYKRFIVEYVETNYRNPSYLVTRESLILNP